MIPQAPMSSRLPRRLVIIQPLPLPAPQLALPPGVDVLGDVVLVVVVVTFGSRRQRRRGGRGGPRLGLGLLERGLRIGFLVLLGLHLDFPAPVLLLPLLALAVHDALGPDVVRGDEDADDGGDVGEVAHGG